MSRVPDELTTWLEDPDPDAVVRDLRAQIARARAVVSDHLDQAHAAGLAGADDAAAPDECNP